MEYEDVRGYIAQYYDDPLGLLRVLGGFYECPRDDSGNRIGPLVGYAKCDSLGRQHVADVYTNFALAETWPEVILHWALQLRTALKRGQDNKKIPKPTVFVGAPEGGKLLAAGLAAQFKARYVYPEKVLIAPATTVSRENTRLEFRRHTLHAGDFAVIVEDVTNNLSTAGALVDLAIEAGAVPIAIVTVFNRSTWVSDIYASAYGSLPVLSLQRQVFPDYQQDDPFVADDVARGNVVFKPKAEWPRLMRVMQGGRDA